MLKILLKFLRITTNYTGTTTVAYKIYMYMCKVNAPYAGLKRLRFYGPYIRSRLDSRKVKDKPGLQRMFPVM